MRGSSIGRCSLRLGVASLLLAGCVAPMARTSAIHRGLSAEGGLCPGIFTGLDTATHDFTGHYAGLQSNLRLAYGFSNMLGVSASFSTWSGWLLGRTSDLGTWTRIALAGLFRPWKTNELLLLEADQSTLTLGAVQGWPLQGRERVSLTVQVGNMLTHALFNGGELPYLLIPSITFCGLSYNIYTRRFRVSPNLAWGAHWSWEDRWPMVDVQSVTAGVTLGK